MRLELALIVGILFFCSWCAYIVARMNASVQPPPQISEYHQSSEPLQQQNQNPMQTTANWSSIGRDYANNLSAIEVPSAVNHKQYQQVSQSGLLNPIASPEFVWQRAQQNQQQHQAPYATYPIPTSLQQRPEVEWRSYALPTSLSRNQISTAPENPIEEDQEQGTGLQEEHQEANQQDNELGDESDTNNSALSDQETAASDYAVPEGSDTQDAEPQQQLQLDEDLNDEGNSENEDEPLQSKVSRPKRGNELEELDGSRVFSELESDSRERDKNGRLIVTRRRHLINGKPVGRRSGQDDTSEQAEASRVRVDTLKAQPQIKRIDSSLGDFDKLVNEIDHDDKLRKLANTDTNNGIGTIQAEESRHHGSTSKPGAVYSIKTSQVKRPKLLAMKNLSQPKAGQKLADDNSHEHRLEEKLSQQQWDDDSSSSVTERPASGADQEAEEQRVGDVVDQDEEARRLEEMSQELLLNPDFAELTRRKRDASTLTDGQNEEGANLDHDESNESPKPTKLGQSDFSQEEEKPTSVDNKIDEEILDEQISSQKDNSNSQIVSSFDTTQVDPKLARLKPIVNDEVVSGLEDMKVEILADPPPPPGSIQAPTTVPVSTPNINNHNLFPVVSSPFVASGSSKVDKKKRVKKLEKKQSKLVDSKLKSAQAYSNKYRTNSKKGQMRKKKKKSQKKLLAGKKHFAGSIRGHKQARGKGIKGGRKGATYYKDKGYKKKGFKRAYHKLETGDHKTYFDEFRDKDQKKKWNNYDDKHKYSQRKKWAGHDLKHMKHHDLKEARGKAIKTANWKAKQVKEQMKRAKKFKAAKKEASKSLSTKGGKKGRKKYKT